MLYTIKLLRADGSVAHDRPLQCNDDDAALEQLGQVRHRHLIELWQPVAAALGGLARDHKPDAPRASRYAFHVRALASAQTQVGPRLTRPVMNLTPLAEL